MRGRQTKSDGGNVGLVRSPFNFPNPVNETTARVVAGLALGLCVLILATQWMWLTIPLAYGFLARVASGPRFSLFGQFASRVVAPRLPAKTVAGPPKRFAQAIGAVCSVGSVVAFYGFGSELVALVLVGFIAVAASLESVLGLCLGCKIFGFLMRHGLIPQETCEACNDVQARLAATA
jgi:hypothetical protein